MKKMLRSRIFLVIVTLIIGISGTLYAANSYNANAIVYNSSDGTSKNVNDALNDLYTKSKKEYYVNGLVAYYNPVTGSKCKVSEATSNTNSKGTYTEVKTGCMKWYIFKEDFDNYTMILDHNTTARIKWNDNNVNVSYENSNIKAEVDKLVSVSKWKNTPRLITANELSKITNNSTFNDSVENNWYFFDSNSHNQTATSKGASTYSWLYDYTSSCSSWGCNVEDNNYYTGVGTSGTGYFYGYWTSTTRGTAGAGYAVWDVFHHGNLDGGDANYDARGIRPVITISKTILK